MKTFNATATSKLGLPTDSYIYSITTTAKQDDVRTNNFTNLTSSDRLLSISSDGSLSIYDPTSLSVQQRFPNTHSSVTSLKRYATNGAQCSTFFTAGRDGTVRGWDIRSQSKALEFSTPVSVPLSAMDCSADLQAVVAGMELEANPPGDVSLFFWDVRSPGSSVKMKYEESHNDSVTELRFLPSHGGKNTLLLSAGIDGLTNIFDTSQTVEEDAIIQTVKSSSALQHAGIVGGDIYTLGTDETLSFHAFQSLDPEIKEPGPCLLGDVREQFGCEYVVNMYTAGSKPYLAVGNHSEGFLDLIRFKNKSEDGAEVRKWKAKPDSGKTVRLAGAHGEELVRDVFMTEDLDFVVTCGEDGMVKLWKGEDAGDGDVEMGGVKSGNKKRKGERSERKEKRSKAGPSA